MLAIAMYSCKKEESLEPDIDGGKIAGTYDFVGMEAKTEADQTIIFDPENTARSITVSHYFSKNNGGTYTFGADKFVATDITYTVDTLMYNSTYWNGELDFEESAQFSFTLPPTSNSATYRLVGTDSIYLTGSPVNVPGSTPAPTEPMGNRYSWAGDTLVIKFEYNNTISSNEDGIRSTMVQKAYVTTRLKKRS